MMQEMNSIVISNGTITKGTPLGKNKAKNLKPCVCMPIILIPMKIDNAKLNVKAI